MSRNGLAEDDPFNRLVAATGLAPREANWMRAVYRYLRQTGVTFTIYTVVDALVAAPQATRAMIDLFSARHDPAFAGNREDAIAFAQTAFTRALAKVTAINDDRLFAALTAQGIDAGSAHQTPSRPRPAAERRWRSRSDQLHLVPGPAQAGAVARDSSSISAPGRRALPGFGLRLAPGACVGPDRRDEYSRTEILVAHEGAAASRERGEIVPTGGQGAGFTPSQLPFRGARPRGLGGPRPGRPTNSLIRAPCPFYRHSWKAGGCIRQPCRCSRGDPYFVVAADKGTATCSDIPNGNRERPRLLDGRCIRQRRLERV